MTPKTSPAPFVPRCVATDRKIGRCGCGHPIMSRSESAQSDAYADHTEFRIRTMAADQMTETIRKEQARDARQEPA